MKCNTFVSCYCLIVFLFLSLILNAQSENKGKVAAYRSDTLYVKSLLKQVDNLPPSELDSTTAILTNVLRLSEQLNFIDGKIEALQKLGSHFYRQGFRYRASDYYLRALAIAETQNKVDYQINLTKKIGDGYVEEDFAKSIFYYKKNLKLNQLMNDQEKYLLALNDIGIANLVHNKLNTALTYFERCQQENNKLNSVKINSASSTNIGVVYALQKKYKKALNQFDSSLKYARVDGYEDTVPFIKNEMAIVYIELGQGIKAIQLASEAIDELSDKYVELKTAIYKTLSVANENAGNTTEALSNYKIFTERKLTEDSLKTKQIINLLNLTFENEEQLQSLNKLNLAITENEYRNNLMILASGAFLLIILLLIYAFRLQRTKALLMLSQKKSVDTLNEKLESQVVERTSQLLTANEELIRKNTEISEALYKGQSIERKRVASELHDNLGSTLTAIKWQFQSIDKQVLSLKEQHVYDNIILTIQNAYSDVRLMSHNLLPAELETKGLAGALSKLITDLNVSGVMSFTLNVSPEFSLDNKRTAMEIYSCCLEAITNTIKHSKASVMQILLSQSNNYTVIRLNDNGIGLQKENEGGAGLKNMLERVKRVSGTVTFKNIEEQGTSIEIKIPLLLDSSQKG